MKAAFAPGVRVRFKTADGALARIVDYELEGFYIVPGSGSSRTKDDLELAP